MNIFVLICVLSSKCSLVPFLDLSFCSRLCLSLGLSFYLDAVGKEDIGSMRFLLAGEISLVLVADAKTCLSRAEHVGDPFVGRHSLHLHHRAIVTLASGVALQVVAGVLQGCYSPLITERIPRRVFLNEFDVGRAHVQTQQCRLQLRDSRYSSHSFITSTA